VPASQEVIVVMLDVGPQMSDHLVHVRKSLFLLAESKVCMARRRVTVLLTQPVLPVRSWAGWCWLLHYMCK
jgi:hypothetical protein